jgi:tetratricopeptide (TPR) repeat protein
MKTVVAFAGIAAFATLVYSNHFRNEFHFDDFHTIVQNPYIADISNVPRFFADAQISGILPPNRVWRPLVLASFAIDYRLGHAMRPFWFHLSTFFWFLVLLALMLALFRKIIDQARPGGAENLWVAAFATALFAVHPAIAETVNYIVQRADLYSTLGVVAGLVIWIYWPGLRTYGLYLLPFAAAMLSKPPAIVFPLLLFLYTWLVDREHPKVALRRSIPSIVAAAGLLCLVSAMTPKSFSAGASSAYSYWITQPTVVFRYFRTFFIPTGLTADTDRIPFASIFDGNALAGFAFVLGLVIIAVRIARRPEWRPVAFGLFWFLLAVLPTSVFPLAEVENDHRMFFPFVGLALSASWAVALFVRSHAIRREVVGALCGLVLIAFAAGTWQRNKVWRTEESLWYDVTLKSPYNGRGLMNYGLTQMAKGDNARALEYFQRALAYTPDYYILEVNLGVVNGALLNDAEAERHFSRAAQLAPTEATSHYFYAVWLRGKGRLAEAIQHLNVAIANNPSYLDAPHLLMEIYAQEMEPNLLRQVAADTLARFPSDAQAKLWMASAGSLKPTAETYLSRSLALYQQRKFDESIEAARQALQLRPDYSEAWNNIAAAYNSESKWDEGISAARQAIRLRPDFQLAKNNLAWAVQQKQKATDKRL